MFSLFRSVPSISIRDFPAALTAKTKVIDVRTPSEYRGGHIRNAANVPLNKIAHYSGKKEPLYVICQSGVRSKQAAKLLIKMGYDATTIRGGMNQWQGPIQGGK
ncbi:MULTISPECIES: rhodanese-like domain-containing protein [Enterococcus]|uniref:rhodanese-like domain-containing protein n=1 Tax=Enterococcus TaxID=1350 RepID=UPI0010FF847F|nr:MULTISPECIES: rhodanese-like domain-containing protein [Enterococcus]QCT90609.1 rhodanese-like domain-containing protein [Enterococcus sp. M190262]GMG57601.1 rhodanese-like domain-containing protein [Enterococcus gallinarum]